MVFFFANHQPEVRPPPPNQFSRLQPTNLISAIPIPFPLCALCVLCGQSPKQPRFPLTTVFANSLLPTSFSAMKYAFLGAGRMASAIIQGMLRANICEPSDIVAACPEPDLLQSLRDATSIKIVSENAEAAAESPVLILCVKPQDAAKALKQTGAHLKNKLLISIAAGLSLETLQNLAPGARVVRAMPNTAAIVGRSATAYAAGSDATPQDRELAESIFSSIGEVYPVEEKLLDAVTGLSGSGPAYVYLVIEALADGGVCNGLPRAEAMRLAAQTVLGAATMVLETGEHPAVLKDMVTSPGGSEGIAIHPVGNLAMSWDHRAFDGAYAANFLSRVKQLLETRDWTAEL